MPILLVTLETVLPDETLTQLKEAGYIVIRTNVLEAIQLLPEIPAIDRDIILNAALDALDTGQIDTPRIHFGNAIRAALKKKNQGK